MATYYADLDAVVPGDGLTILTPWDSAQFKTNAKALAAGSTIKLKGEHDYGTGFANYIEIYAAGSGGTSQNAFTVEAWDPLTPPRIKTDLLMVGWGATINNLIVDSTDYMTIVEGTTVIDCQLKAVNYINIVDNSSSHINVIKGSTLVAPSIRGGSTGQFSNNELTDSIFDGALTFFESTDSTNCVFTAASVPGGGTHTNAQTGWTPPSWPLWNALQAAFDSSVLSVGLLTPPEPGTPPYTGYATGLFNSTRIGIGAMDFTTIPVPIPTGTRYIAKVTANGWIKDHIYEFDGTQWTDTPPVEGACVVIKELFDTYTFLNGAWTENNVPWLDPVISIFNNTVALPVAPANGDRYIAQVTANGWTINYVYEWNGNTWIGTTPTIGMFIFNEATSDTLYYSGLAWVIFSPLTVHAIGGPLHSASTVTDIKTKVSGPDFLVTSQANELTGLTAKATPVSADILVIEDSADTNKKKRITVGTLPSTTPTGTAGGDLAGTYPNPTVAQVSKSFNLTGIINDTIAAQKNNYNPLGLADASTIQLTLTGDQTITGLAGGVAGRIIIIQSGYTGSTDKLTLKNNSGASLAANRFFCPLSTDYVLSDDNCVILQYDGIQQKWVIIATCQAPYGTGVNTICEGNDSRLSDSRTPTSHASTHQFGGSDPVHTTWQWGTGAPPATTGLPDGALYIKYIP